MSREHAQQTLEALDALGVALVDHGHVWTSGERSAYERAARNLKKAAE